MVADQIITLLSPMGQALQPIAIRKYQPYLSRPGVISFAGGWPSPEMFPLELVAEISRQVLLEEGGTALQYGATQGHPPLIRAIVDRLMAVQEVVVGEKQICVTAGAQQGIYLAALLLLAPGDFVAVEAPTFSGALSVFKGFQAQILSIPLDDQGLQTDVLEGHLAAGRRIKMVYTIPDFQNPTGRTLSASRRQALVDLAERYDFFILEDAPYSELRYGGRPLPPILSFDRGGRVIFLGSFSKVFAPLRLGWMAASSDLIDRAIIAKQGIDLCCPSLTQAIMTHFIGGGHLETQIERIRAYYGSKREVMLAGLDRHLPAGCEWTSPEGGMFIWVTLPELLNTDQLFFPAIEEKIAFVPGSAFYPDEKPCSALRLNFVSASPDDISRGMAAFGRVLKAELV